MPNSKPPVAMGRPTKYIARPHELKKIHDAIYPQERLCHVVLIKGEGGLGKTRLLEEVMSRLGHAKMRQMYPHVEEDWQREHPSQAVISELIDFIQIHLHTRDNFLEALGSRYNWPEALHLRFTHFQRAYTSYKRTLDAGSNYATIKEKKEELENAFWQDYKNATATQRLVIPLDTAEQLSLLSSQWLMERDILTREDLEDHTQKWLIDCIKKGYFANTTFLIAGRAKQGKRFFEEVEKALQSSTEVCHYTTIDSTPFHLTEIKDFYLALATDATQEQPALAQAFNELAYDTDQLEVLHLFTGGQPVRLSLYTDILFEGQKIPEPLNLSLREAQAIEDLDLAQGQIELAFVKSLFRPKYDNLRTKILQALVRASRGLTAEQLHYILYSQGNSDAQEWDENLKYSDKKKQELDDVLMALESITHLSIVKIKNRFEQKRTKTRYTLQDEVYRIYARCMKKEPSRTAEIKARKALYSKIIAWLEPKRIKFREEAQHILQKRLEGIALERYDKALLTKMPYIAIKEQEELDARNAQQVELDLEYLHYQLLLDPYRHFYDTYFDLGSNKDTARDLAVGSLFQAELARTLNEEHTTLFIDFEGYTDRENFDEHINTLQRMITQNDVARWILVFAMHGRYPRAIELADQIEKDISQISEEGIKHSWQKPETAAERICWKARAFAFQDNYEMAINLIIPYLPVLQTLADTKFLPQEQVFGYKGTPSEKRLNFLIAEMHNTLGYIATQKGNFRQGVDEYTQGQQELRYAGTYKPVLANVLNNQSRALAEMGLRRSKRIALDGLNMRQELGSLIPIALSYNTLSLIHNLFYEPQLALGYCLRAYAIAQEIGDERTLGLVYLEIAIGLRRLVRSNRQKYLATTETEAIYGQAEEALQLAFEKFSELTKGHPSLRLVETKIELGCLYRAWLNIYPENRHYYLQSKSSLQEAINMANTLHLERLVLDAQVNLAQTHARFGELGLCGEALEEANKTIERVAPSAFFQKGQIPNPVSEEESTYRPYYIFRQLAKIERIKGKLAMDRFWDATKKIKSAKQQGLAVDQFIANRDQFLRETAKAFAFATSYAEIFAPHSHIQTSIYDDLYASMSKFNPLEMRLYYQFDEEIINDYRLNELKPQDMGDTRGFLRDSFGKYLNASRERLDGWDEETLT